MSRKCRKLIFLAYTVGGPIFGGLLLALYGNFTTETIAHGFWFLWFFSSAVAGIALCLIPGYPIWLFLMCWAFPPFEGFDQ